MNVSCDAVERGGRDPDAQAQIVADARAAQLAAIEVVHEHRRVLDVARRDARISTSPVPFTSGTTQRRLTAPRAAHSVQ
jgi:hypothetical protein